MILCDDRKSSERFFISLFHSLEVAGFYSYCLFEVEAASLFFLLAAQHDKETRNPQSAINLHQRMESCLVARFHSGQHTLYVFSFLDSFHLVFDPLESTRSGQPVDSLGYQRWKRKEEKRRTTALGSRLQDRLTLLVLSLLSSFKKPAKLSFVIEDLEAVLMSFGGVLTSTWQLL